MQKVLFMKKKQLWRQLLVTPAILAFSFSMAQNYEATVKKHIDDNLQLKSLPQELKSFEILNVDASKSLNADVVDVQQKINGLPLYNGISTFLIKDSKIINATEGFISNLSNKNIPSAKPKLSKEEAFQSFSKFAQIKNESSSQIGNKTKLSDFVSKLLYFKKNNDIRLAYELQYEEKGTPNIWKVFIDANNGELLYLENTTISEHVHSGIFANNDDKHGTKTVAYPLNKPEEKSMSFAADNASYNVFQLPIEAPNFGNRSIAKNPWLIASSPEGWHSDGTNKYTITRGNNVYAYTDTAGTDTVGETADGGSALNFDFPLDITLPVTNYTKAAITNLFYMNNMMHDIFYKFGFTESSRNYQSNNFGKGGKGNDPVLAEARDGSGTNNANFNAGSDGTSGRMQMFLWDPAHVNGLVINKPSDLSSLKIETKYATFGPKLNATGVTGDLILANPIKGCTALTNPASFVGKIAFVERGDCEYTIKVKNAQDAGAIGVIIYNQINATNFGVMGGTNSAVTIPSILIQNTDGNTLKNALVQNPAVNVTIKDDPTALSIDGSLDNGIISHEYGHGISNRLTGNGEACLSTNVDNEQMGEGWSDFIALMLTLRPTDNATIPRGLGTSVYGQNTTGAGIRPAKYSPDFSINNYTYGKTNGMVINSKLFGILPITTVDVHSVGFIWASMLWDLNWKYVEKYGYNSNVLADPDAGTARVLQLVVDGMKLQPCNPTFVQGRDAIIAADKASTGGQNKCLIWETFAKRGLGVNAKPGGLTGIWYKENDPAPEMNDQVEDFSLPADCALAVNDTSSNKAVALYPNPAKNELFIKGDSVKGKTIIKIYDMSGKLVKEELTDISSGKSINVSNLSNGLYIIKGEGIGINFSEKIIIKK